MSDKPNRPVIVFVDGKLQGQARIPDPNSLEAKLDPAKWDTLDPKQQSDILREIALGLVKDQSVATAQAIAAG